MALLIFSMCFVTALGCAAILARAYLRTRHGLLLWSGLCFTALAGNEALVILDLYILPELELLAVRRAMGLLAAALMLVGLILHDRGPTK